MQTVHFLHIGKTGGTAIKSALAGAHHVVAHPHETRLRDIPAGEPVLFVLRDPLARFVSGFNSRLRQGRPRYDVPWTREEATVFARYRTPNDLAEALDETAMRSIQHVKDTYADTLGSPEALEARRSDIAFIGRVETLDRDWPLMSSVLRVSASLPLDDVAAHRSPLGLDTHLSAKAAGNLRRWYARDFDILAYCEHLRSKWPWH